MTTKNAAETTVTIACPRCSGEGSRPLVWQPDAGICYLCSGKAELKVNIERGERHLECLRRDYRKAVKEGSVEWAAHIAQKGIFKKELVELAKARKAELDARVEPPMGSWAQVARMMAAGDTSGFDWDAWKDEQKEMSL